MARSSAPPSAPGSHGTLEMTLSGHLTEKDLEAALAPLTSRLRGTMTSYRLRLDCRRMIGYEAPARALFVEWNRTYRRRIDRVAIVTSNTLWHMVIRAMSLASNQEMRPFDEPAAAAEWLARGSP